MKGSREFAEFFKTGQYGKLYIVSGTHARGTTFRIQILPDGEKAKPNGSGNLCLNTNAVEVYGIVSGQPGWTESYGWLYHGKWEDDFNSLLKAAIEKKEMDSNKKANVEVSRKAIEDSRIAELLATY